MHDSASGLHVMSDNLLAYCMQYIHDCFHLALILNTKAKVAFKT